MAKRAALGGTFDPVTAGHIYIQWMLCATGIFDKIYIIPSGRRPDKIAVASPKLRLMWLKIMKSTLPEEWQDMVEIDDRDIDRENTPTADLMRLLSRENPDSQLFFVVGADLVEPKEIWNGKCAIRQQWNHGNTLWDSTNFVVVPRVGYADPHTFGLDPNKFIILPDAPPETASSLVRENRKQGKEWMHMIGNESIIDSIIYSDIYL